MTDNTAFLFPGQGAQYVGMGQSLVSARPEAAKRVEEANDALGFDIGALIAEGPEDNLKLTQNTQPAILLVSVIAAEALLDRMEITPAVTAGHSLGEFSACWAAGAIEFNDVIRLVRKRGELMQSAVPVGEGAMAAIIGIDADAVRAVCDEAGGEVAPANFNSPEQTVIAGRAADVEKAAELAKSSGAKKAIMLPVSAPFHTSMMKPAQEGLAEFMQTIEFKDPTIPILRNIDSGLSQTAQAVADGLIAQVTGCVQWVDSMNRLIGMGVTQCYEIGPGRTLGGLMRRIDKSVKVIPMGEANDLEKL